MNWTAAEDQTIRDLWGKATSHGIAAQLKKSRNSVVNRARYLGVIPHIRDIKNKDAQKRRRGWLVTEDETIRKHWGDKTVVELAEMLTRSRKHVANRAKQLGLPSARDAQEFDSYDPNLSPCKPTSAEPGSPEKIAALRHRIANKQHLWHIDDPILRHPYPEMRTFSGMGRAGEADETVLDSFDLEDSDE